MSDETKSATTMSDSLLTESEKDLLTRGSIRAKDTGYDPFFSMMASFEKMREKDGSLSLGKDTTDALFDWMRSVGRLMAERDASLKKILEREYGSGK